MERTPPLPPHAPPPAQEQQAAAPPHEETRRKTGRQRPEPGPLRVYRVDPRGFRSLVQRLTGSPRPPRPPPTTEAVAPTSYSNAQHSNVSRQFMAPDAVQDAPREYYSANCYSVNAASSHGDGVPLGLVEEAGPAADMHASVAAGGGGASDQLWSPMSYAGYNWEYLPSSSLHSAITGKHNNK